MIKKLIYLASPYTHTESHIMDTRWINICSIAAKLHKKGVNVLCPIASSHPIQFYGDLKETSWKYWKELDLNYISRCDEIWICMLDKEWKKSVGMKAEYDYAKIHKNVINKKIKIKFIDWVGNLTKRKSWDD